MVNVFNAMEICEMAARIERDAGNFYRAASERVKDNDAKELLLKLSRMEDEHEGLFGRIKNRLMLKEGNAEMLFDLDEQAVSYLRAIVDGEVFEALCPDINRLDPQAASVEEVIRMALEFEKHTVLFFTSIKAMVPELLGQETIDELIREEVRHVAMLTGRLAAMKRGM